MAAILIPSMVLTKTAIALNPEKFYALIARIAALVNISLNQYLMKDFSTIATV